MPFDLQDQLARAKGRHFELHEQHINPQFAKVLRTIGFDKYYTRGVGQYLWDEQGARYLDMIAGYGVFALGRNHPALRAALHQYLDLDYPSLVQLEAPLLSGLLAAELKKRMPNELDIVYFTNSGTEGNETAIKFARCATGRPAIIHCRKAFHGLTTGSLALNGDESFRQGFAPFLPHTRMVPFDDLVALERELARGDVAAFIVEPVQGKGVNIPAPGYLRAAADLCRKAGTLFVADEVQSGMGRTGKFLAVEHDQDVDPDIVVLSKALSGGFVPVGAVLTRRWIYDRVFSSLDRAVVHSSTFGQGGMAMAAGLATLAAFDELDVVHRAEQIGRKLGEGLRALQGRFELIKEIRWRGGMIGIEFGPPKSIGLRAGWTMTHAMNQNLFPQAVTIPLMQDHRILTQVAGHHIDVIKLLPPLIIEDDDIAWFLRGFEQVMQQLEKFPGPAWEVVSRLGKIALTRRESASSAEERPSVASAAPTAQGAAEAESIQADHDASDAATGSATGTWLHRLTRHFVRPLVGTRVTPNHLTTLRLLTGIGAIAAFASGGPGWSFVGGLLFVLSVLLDNADGELARLSDKKTPFGHRYDLWSDIAVTVLLFPGIGFGLTDSLGIWGPMLGMLVGISIAAIFAIVTRMEEQLGSPPPGSVGSFSPDELMILVGPVAWFGGLELLLLAAAIGAPAYLGLALRRMRRG